MREVRLEWSSTAEEIVKPLSAQDLRECMVNATRDDLERMPIPGLHEVIWNEREYLGWRDARSPQRGYLAHWAGDRPVGVVLRASTGQMAPGIAAMCMLCRTPQPSAQVRLFTAPRAGQAGIDGSTIGTYICADLACSIIIRITPPPSPAGPDPAEVIASRAAGLLERVSAFTANVMRSA